MHKPYVLAGLLFGGSALLLASHFIGPGNRTGKVGIAAGVACFGVAASIAHWGE